MSDRRAEERHIKRELRKRGCRCVPTIRRDAAGAYAEHEKWCPLGARVVGLNDRGWSVGVVVGPTPSEAFVEPVPRIPISAELIEHVTQQHRGRCPCERSVETVCPCGAVFVIVCCSCEQPVWLFAPPDDWCEHAQELMSDSPHWWGSRGEGSWTK